MRKLAILSLILLSVISTSSVLQGQDKDSDFSILFSTVDIKGEDLAPIIEYLRGIESELSNENFDVYINQRGSDFNLQLLINQYEDDEDIYNFAFSAFITYVDDTHLDSKITDISPVLLPRFNVGFSLETSFDIYINSEGDILVPFLRYFRDYWSGDCHAVISNYDDLDLEMYHIHTQSFIQFLLANCFIILDDFDNAKAMYRSSLDSEFDANLIKTPITLGTTRISPSTHLAWIYLNEGDPEMAIQVMNTMVDELTAYLESDFPDLYMIALQMRAQIFALAFDYTSAIQDMDTVIDLATSDFSRARAYKQRGDIIMLIYEWNRALDDYNMAIELDPDYAEAYYRRGILYYTMVERENAIADFETYLELAPEGQFVDSAEQYIEDIQTELEALGG